LRRAVWKLKNNGFYSVDVLGGVSDVLQLYVM
jgi:hypothetical protein